MSVSADRPLIALLDGASYDAFHPVAAGGRIDAVVANAGTDLVRFLVGSQSRRITGQLLGVDGGHALRAGPDFSQFVPPDPLTRGGTP